MTKAWEAPPSTVWCSRFEGVSFPDGPAAVAAGISSEGLETWVGNQLRDFLSGDTIMEGCRASCRALSPELQVSRARLVKLGNLEAIKALIIGAVDDFLRWFHAVEGRGNL